jgi:NADH dehydrogenase FAD-containing subunit
MAANPELAAALDVVVLERGSVVHVGATNQMAFMNIIRPEEAAVPLSKLKFKHARLVHDEVLSVDTAARVVTTRSGRFPYDRLVVALG